MENPQSATAGDGAHQGGAHHKKDQQPTAQNISLGTKFLFGLKGDVKNNIFFLDDQTVIYPCGHNIVFYNTDDKVQKYIPGIEGSEGISALALSPSKKFLAVCEIAEKAVCCVFDTSTLKRRKILTSMDYNSKSFVSVNFAPSNEKSLLVTLTAEPDIKVILWTWDKAKCFTHQQVGGVSEKMSAIQCSFHNQDSNTVLVTGNNTYKFYRVQDNNILKPTHTSILKKEAHISTNYTCHTWLPDGRLLICTDQGEIMLLEANGDYKMMLQESPCDGFYIECIQTYSKGFIIAGDNGTIMIYDKNEDAKNPYIRNAKLPQNDKKDKGEYSQLLTGIMQSRIRCMALSATDDCIIFTTDNNQLMKVNVNLESPLDESKYEYLIFPFHSRKIEGMDICIKKNYIATCSIDKTVRIWNNSNPPSLEICQVFNEEAYSVAYHPSGFHLIVGFTDRVRMMNVFSKSLKQFHAISIKGCREIKFSNGGHLFACACQNNINVYKFYTGENTPDMIYKSHKGPVKCIAWYDDDSGFISGGWDGIVHCWKLFTDKKDPKDVNPKFHFKLSNQQFSSVANRPDSKQFYYATAIDKTIKLIKEGDEIERYEAGSNISQIQVLHGNRALFAGISENDRPGSIQVIRFPFERIFEIQAHSLPIERLRVSYDNQYLYSAGSDGMFGIFHVVDKDPVKREKEFSQVTQSDEILIEKAERDKIQADIEQLKNKIEVEKQKKEASVAQELDKKMKKINDLKNEIENKTIEQNTRYDQLMMAKHEMENNYKERIKQLIQAHEIEMERRRNDYAEKMDADQQRFDELQAQKDEDNKKFEARLNELTIQHEKIIKELNHEQKIDADRQTQEKNMLAEEIEQMMRAHKEEREKLENDAWEEIDILKDRNKEELAKHIDAGMESKCQLTMVSNEFKTKEAEQKQEENNILKMQNDLSELWKKTNHLKQTIESQDGELKERATTIEDKNRRILDLRKKTQELEKFKFVLDYKIKELKKEIGPREMDIQKLNEQTNKMRQELKHFNRVNQNLALIVDDLRMRQEGLTNEVQNLRQQLDEQESYKKKFKDDVFECLHHITDFKKLKAGVIRLHKKYVKEELKNEAGDTDLHREYANKRRYLENNVNYLRTTLQKDQEVHKKENSKIMSENVYLLQEINDQRKECHALKQKIKQNQLQINEMTMGQSG